MTAQEFGPACTCITCSDQGLEMVVESVDETTWLARCHETADAGEPAVAVDVELVGPVAIGDVVLVHAGVALALLAKAAPA